MEGEERTGDKRADKTKVPSSFRDPSGFVFKSDGAVLRQINSIYKENYEMLMGSGLYSKIVEEGLLIPHKEVDITNAVTNEAYKVIEPEQLGFISYPYEWCFSQLKDAAILTLQCQKTAMKYGMSLRDCSAYNIQFYHGRPILIDTLSFEKFREGTPWVAYRQFCQHFLAPLALMAYSDIRLNQLLRIYIEGIPLDLASALLPVKTRFLPSILLHIHLHAKAQKRYAGRDIKDIQKKMSRLSFEGLIDNLEQAVAKMKLKKIGTEWGEYYSDTNYSDRAFGHKKSLVSDFLDCVRPKTVWDLGANTGVFSRIASSKNIQTVSMDIDPVAVEKNYLEVKANRESNIIPLLIDLTNPSPGTGWGNKERSSLAERGPVDVVMALALIHHLAISNNLPLDMIAEYLGSLCDNLICEFIPRDDSQFVRLLASREDIFNRYTQPDFEAEFCRYFEIRKKEKIADSRRTLYLMSRRN